MCAKGIRQLGQGRKRLGEGQRRHGDVCQSALTKNEDKSGCFERAEAEDPFFFLKLGRLKITSREPAALSREPTH